jgi:FemAB-related protein (PEP-CTERM system-associated)
MTVVSSATDAREWDAYVDAHADATGYHLWAWRHVFESAFGHSCEYLIARRHDRVTGVLPLVIFRTWLFGRFGVSLPFVNYGGVLASDAETAQALLDRAMALADAASLRHVELRHRDRVFARLPFRQHKVAMLLPLASTPSAMWDGFDRKVRNQVRKAEKSGLSAASGGAELMADFYTLFAANMRDLGTPVYSRRFFQAVLEAFPDRTRVWIVRLEERPVAGAVSFGYRRTLEVPWAASLKAYRSLCPNNLLYWAVIQHAVAEGFDTFDFGRSTPDEGTFQFKRQWGAEPRPLCWEYHLASQTGLPDQSPKNPKFRWAIEAWKRLPLRVTMALGPPIVRCIP